MKRHGRFSRRRNVVENVRSAMSEEWLMLQHFSNPHHPHCGKMMKSSLSFSMTLCVDNIDFKILSDLCLA